MGDAELIKLIAGGGGFAVFAIFVAMQLRDQTRLLASLCRKNARTEQITVDTYQYLTGKRIPRAATSPIGVPIARSKATSDEPPNVARTTTEDFEGG